MRHLLLKRKALVPSVLRIENGLDKYIGFVIRLFSDIILYNLNILTLSN